MAEGIKVDLSCDSHPTRSVVKSTYILILEVVQTVVPLEDEPPPVPDIAGFVSSAG